VERAELKRVERIINRELSERFAAGAVRHGTLLGPGDDPQIEPGQLMVRVFIPPPAEPGNDEQALTAWQDAHRTAMESFRRELSLRLPAARRLEFTFTDPGADTPRITMPDDGTLAAEQLSGREIVTKALALLRANYVFPALAEQAAVAVEARLEAGQYDELDEIALTELVTEHLREVCDDKHLAVRLGGPGPGPGGPRRRPGSRIMQGALDPENPANHEARRLAMRQMGRLDNFGIHRVERLPATSVISTSAGSPTRPTPGRPSPRRWNSWPARTP